MAFKPRDLLKDELKMHPIEHSGKPLSGALITGTGALVLQKLMDTSVYVRRLLQDYG